MTRAEFQEYTKKFMGKENITGTELIRTVLLGLDRAGLEKAVEGLNSEEIEYLIAVTINEVAHRARLGTTLLEGFAADGGDN